MGFVEQYQKEVKNFLRTSFGRKLTKREVQSIEKRIELDFKDSPVEKFNSYYNETKNSDLLPIVDWMIDERPIITGNGTFFRTESRHEGKNICGSFVGMLIDARDVKKKKKFQAKEELKKTDLTKKESATLERVYAANHLGEKAVKIFTNAYFGSMGMSAFIFNDDNCAPAITGAGQTLSTTLIQGFEMFLGDNWFFESPGDIISFLRQSKLRSKETSLYFDLGIDAEMVLERLESKISNRGKMLYDSLTKKVIVSILERMDEKELFDAYFRNNFYEFITIDEIEEKIKDILPYFILSGNPGDIKDPETKKVLMDFSNSVMEVCYFPHFYEDRMEFCMFRDKTTVLLTDTDSAFIYLNPFVRFLKEEFDYDIKNQEKRLTACSILIFIISKFAELLLMDWCERCNIDEKFREMLAIKNEFLFSRLMITEGKKRYAGLVLAVEGKLLKEPELDIKGLDIKKTGTMKTTREYFTEVLKEEILYPEKISIFNVLQKFAKFEDIATKSLKNAEATYGKPLKFSGFDAYKAPYSQEVVRGVIAWNTLFEDETILPMDNVISFKLVADNLETFNAIIKRNKFSEEELEYLEKIKETFFDDEELVKYGWVRFAIPKNFTEFPKWLIPFLDIETIVNDNIQTALDLLQSLKVSILDYGQKRYYTNIITL
jgi:hypothetical protein